MPRYMDAYWVYCFYRDFSVRNPLKIPMETKAWAKGSPELVEFGVRVGEMEKVVEIGVVMKPRKVQESSLALQVSYRRKSSAKGI